jgi:caffeoyl-CoA O-methyltransferase
VDLIFSDIEKQGYPAALRVITHKLRPGGALIVDNMLWKGRVFDQSDRSPATQGVRELTRRIKDDPGWIVSILPVHDGLLVDLKR